MPYGWSDTYTFTECCNAKVLANIVKRKAFLRHEMRIFPDSTYDPFAQSQMYLWKLDSNGCFKNRYSYIDNTRLGRMYSIYPISLQNMIREIRQTILHHNYSEVDIYNAFPNFFLYLCELFGYDTEYLSQYANEREGYLQELIATRKNCTEYQGKIYVIRLLYGMDESQPEDPPFFKMLAKEILENVRKIPQNFPIVTEYAKTLVHEPPYGGYEGFVCQLLMQTAENYIMHAILYFLKTRKLINREVVLLFDGVIIPDIDNIAKVMAELQTFVMSQYNIDLKIRHKRMEEMFIQYANKNEQAPE